MKIYHGSKNSFKEFDYNLIRTNATTEGVGFYCTDNIAVAKQYSYEGYIMEYEYVGNKQLNSNEVSLTREELSLYMKKLNEVSEFLSCYGDVEWEGYNNVLNTALDNILEWSEDDIDIISQFCTICGDFEKPLTILYEVLGYDSAIIDAKWGDQKIYLILNNNAIKHLSTIKYKEAC